MKITLKKHEKLY